jgi:hypothetical protein
MEVVCFVSLLPIRATYHSHPPPHDNSNYTWRRVQATQLLVMQLSPPSHHFIPLPSKYSQVPSSLCSSLNIGGQVSSRHRTTGKIIVLHIPVLTFSDRDEKTECSGPNGTKHYRMETNSVSLVRKRTGPTERPPLVDEVDANFCG